MWNIGDVIGVAIDMDEKIIEYFRNGISLGKFFSDIPIGENRVYFPSILLGYKQKIFINFGQEQYFYNYGKYNCIDLREADIRGYLKVSKTLVEFLEQYYFNFLFESQILRGNLIAFFSDFFQALTNITFEDDVTIKETFIPLLIKINDIQKMDDIFKNCYLTLKYAKKNEIFLRLISCIFLCFYNTKLKL